jgi:hypothetical protein
MSTPYSVYVLDWKQTSTKGHGAALVLFTVSKARMGPKIIYWISETLRENELHIVDGVISTF